MKRRIDIQSREAVLYTSAIPANPPTTVENTGLVFKGLQTWPAALNSTEKPQANLTLIPLNKPSHEHLATGLLLSLQQQTTRT